MKKYINLFWKQGPQYCQKETWLSHSHWSPRRNLPEREKSARLITSIKMDDSHSICAIKQIYLNINTGKHCIKENGRMVFWLQDCEIFRQYAQTFFAMWINYTGWYNVIHWSSQTETHEVFFNLYLLVSLKAIVSFSEQLQSHSHSYTFTLGVVGVQALLAFPKK